MLLGQAGRISSHRQSVVCQRDPTCQRFARRLSKTPASSLRRKGLFRNLVVVFLILRQRCVNLRRKRSVRTFSSSASAHRSFASLNTRTIPSLLPLTISPLGIAETAHTEMAGCTMTCVHSPSEKTSGQSIEEARSKYLHLSIRGRCGPRRLTRYRRSAATLESTQMMCAQTERV